MSDASLARMPATADRSPGRSLTARIASSPAFQRWASGVPVLRRFVRAEGEAIFDVVAGFLHSQVLHALVELDVLGLLAKGPRPVPELARLTGVPERRMEILVRAGVALGLLKFHRKTNLALTNRGAALLGVPGLLPMIAHHSVLYRDMADPSAFFRCETEPELAGFWPYVFGPGATIDPDAARRYSDLMADSQGLVAEETLRAVSLKGVRRLLDVGGGSGAFLAAAAKKWPHLDGTLFDLPQVAPAAEARFATDLLSRRITTVAGNFRSEPLPPGADAISLVRVLYDHSDETIAALLSKVHAALPKGGRVIVSEPMTGGTRPNRPGDAYFALYCLAMGTGKARSPHEICLRLGEAGFSEVRHVPTYRSFVTSVVTAVRAA